MHDFHKKASRIKRLLYFFPVQLLLLHLKRNHLLLIFWGVFFGYITGNLGQKYGAPFLFTTPEYLGEVSPIAYAILGFSLGGFVMAFNIYTYIMHGYKFPFIATVSRPFYKFCINNSSIPVVFILTYFYNSAIVQSKYELLSYTDIFLNLLSFLIGTSLFFIMSIFYFFKTNKDLIKLTGKSEEELEKDKPYKAALHKNKKWHQAFKQKGGWHIRSYFSGFFRIKYARESKHYNRENLKKIFSQNHINASIFEIVIIISFVILGLFKENQYFLIPAAASVFLLLSMIVMLISILYSWLKKWTIFAVATIIVGLNYISSSNQFSYYQNKAYGINYETDKAKYSFENLQKIALNKDFNLSDYENGIKILENWKLKNVKSDSTKPKLVIINTSGGGSRSMLWTFNVLQELDTQMNGELMNKTQMITGSSGGILGASYYRELDIRKNNGELNSITNEHKSNAGKDMLNSIIFTIATNDLLVKWQSFNDGKYTYAKDRAYMFERQLNENTNYVLDKRLKDYQELESSANTPLLFLSPTIINDGRRLIISAQPVSYLSNNTPNRNTTNESQIENVEFSRLFMNQDAKNLKFTSALRMSATFPYVLPMVNLPTSPNIEVMDAGLRDNYGIKLTMKYLEVFQDWINENTSGIVILQIRDRHKIFESKETKSNSLFRRLFKPFGSLYENFTKTQDFNNDRLIQQFSNSFDGQLDVVTFDLLRSSEKNISLSWHLTKLEKSIILEGINNQENQSSIEKVLQLIQ